MSIQEVAQTLARQGTEISPESIALVHGLYKGEQLTLARQVPVSEADIAYGPHERHRLDIYRPADGGSSLPVLVFVHGGGFLRGDKGGDGSKWPNANVGRMAASRGMIGVVVNYRLAPDNVWPSGSEDLAMVVDWLRTNVAEYGGDPDRIVIAGTSAGAAHVAGYLKHRPGHASEVRGAIFLSGVYGVTPMDDRRDRSYYGEDETRHATMAPLNAVSATKLPLLVCCAQFDPPRFQAEFLGLLQRRLEQHGELPRTYVASGHNHFSMAYHLGSSDRRLADEVEWFVRENTDSTTSGQKSLAL